MQPEIAGDRSQVVNSIISTHGTKPLAYSPHVFLGKLIPTTPLPLPLPVLAVVSMLDLKTNLKTRQYELLRNEVPHPLREFWLS